MSTRAIDLNSSPARCPVVPTPAVANAICPGRARANAITSLAFFTGTEGCTVIIIGTTAILETGVKSRTGWYGRLRLVLTLMAWVDEVPTMGGLPSAGALGPNSAAVKPL